MYTIRDHEFKRVKGKERNVGGFGGTKGMVK